MNVTFFDRDNTANVLNGTAIHDDNQLSQILAPQNAPNRSPYFCELISENGFCLLVGVGEVGCAQYSRCDGNMPCLMAVSDEKGSQGGCHEFLIEGVPTPVRTRFCISFDSVLEIARYFRETGGAYPAILWEQM
jgi:hypothetical protein